jgi:aconitate hydratase
MTSLDSFKCRKTLKVGSKTYVYYSLPAAEKNGLKGISKLPYSMKVLLENLLRNEDGRTVTKEDIQAVAAWLKTKSSEREILEALSLGRASIVQGGAQVHPSS